ncbi:MAG: hypothetical protein CFE21_12505 [Bacteroidetes bacterium B1(2017)]|nr:MAG: hypothetical protein CFE21_12505 [Bacteroidetes bacterium B1(2017)]
MKIKSTRNWLKYAFLTALIAISGVTYTNTSGPSAGLTGAPSEGSCSSCHGASITSGTAHSSITLTGIPAGGYSPGTTYTLTLAGASAATSKNGFQITALNSSNAMAGSFTAGTGSQALTSGSRAYVGHTSSGTSQSSFTFSWTAPSPAAGTVTFYVAYNATNSNSSSDVGDAVYLKSFAFTPGNLPVASITSPATNAVFCLGDTIQFSGSGTNSPTSYNWSFLGNIPNASTQQNPKVVFTVAGFTTVRLTATNSSGTSPIATISVQIVAKPTATITPSASQVICGNDSITLSANAGTGLTYLWSPGNMTSKDVKIGAAGSYTVKVTNSAGCFKTSNAVATSVVTKPSITIQTNADTICTKDSLLVTGTSGFSLYRYFVNGVQVDSSASASKKFKLVAGSASIGIKGFNGTCTSDLASKQITVLAQDPAPSLSCGTTTPSSITFNVGGTNTQISLDSGQNWITPNAGSSHVLTGLAPNQSKVAWARGVSANVCQYSIIATRTCVASNCQPITMQLSYPKVMCAQGASIYKFKVLSTNAVNPYYKLSNPPAAPIGYSKMDSFTISPLVGGNFTISIIDSANVSCGIKDSLVVIPTINLQTGFTTTSLKVCKNADLSFDVTVADPLVDMVKLYNFSGTELGSKYKSQGYKFGPIPVSPTFDVNSTIKITLHDTASGCATLPAVKPVSIDIPALPKIQAFTANLNIELRDTTAASASRSWNFGDGNTSSNSARNVTHTYAAAGSYKAILSIVDGNGCNNKDSVQLTIVATGLATNKVNDLFTMYPNPTSSDITLTWDGTKTGKLEVFDVNSKQVLSTEVQSGKGLSLDGLSKGIYLLKLELGSEIGYRKLILN